MIRSQYMNLLFLILPFLSGWTDKKLPNIKETIINMAKLFFILFLEIIQ